MSTFATVVIQDLTYTSLRLNQVPSITYTNTGTAGSEVVTVDANHNIFIAIESGVSTAAQIKAAIDTLPTPATGLEANGLVSVAVTGTAGTAQLSAVLAELVDGTAAVKAVRTIGHLVYTATTAGAAGNSTRIRYTSGGSLSVSVSSADITVQLKNDGSSTNALIAAAIAASGPAAALVVCTSDGLAMSFVPTTYMAPAFIALSGGLDAAASSVEIQDLTISGDLTGSANNGRLISYANTASAGAETVVVTAGDVVVGIESGASTATQVKAAMDASGDFNGVSASGSITVDNYAQLHLTKAAGTITVDNYAQLHLTAATGVVTVVDYTKLAEATAAPSGVITFGAPNDGDTVILTDLPTDGSLVFTKATAVSEVKATGAITFGVPSEGDTVIVDGSTFTKSTAVVETNATLAIGTLTYTAVTPYDGTAGNAITVEYVADITGDQAVVEVTALAILVHMDATAVTGTTGNTIKAAVNADPEASLLVLVSGTDANVQAAQGPTNLAGGLDEHILTATEFETIAELEVLVEAVVGLNSVVNVGDIDITSTLTGVLGNAQTLAVGVGNTGTLAVSGPNLTGGIDAYVLGPTEFEAIADLTALFQALTDLNASDDATDITLVAQTPGTAMNSATITGTGAYVALSVTFSGGQDHAVLTIDGTAFVEGTDWTAEVNESTTAANIGGIVNPESVGLSFDGPVVTVDAATAGSAGNAITLATSDPTNLTISGSVLSGGYDAATVTVAGHLLTESSEWTAETSDQDTTDSLTAAINLAAVEVDADDNSGASTTITIDAATAGIAGNSITLATSDAVNLLKSAATLLGGYDAAVISIDDTDLTESVEWTAATTDQSTADSIVSAINTAFPGVLTATDAAGASLVVTITADAIGSAGNAHTIETSDAINLLKSGDTLEGGTDGLAATITGTGSTAQVTVNATPMTGQAIPSPLGFYTDNTIAVLTTSFVRSSFNNVMNTINIFNDETTGTKAVIFSIDGTNVSGTLLPGQSVQIQNANVSGISLKYAVGAPAFRCYANGPR